MLVLCVFAFLITFACATKKVCSEGDTKLLNYIDWQMKSTKCTQNNTPRKCVCKPKEKQPIAFFARLNQNLVNLPNEAVVIFKAVITNEGKAYDSSTGRFTCPEDGVYSFSWTILTQRRKRFNSKFVVDGTVIAYNHNEADNSQDENAASHFVVVKLKKGSKAWIRTFGGEGKYAHSRWFSFSGFKI